MWSVQAAISKHNYTEYNTLYNDNAINGYMQVSLLEGHVSSIFLLMHMNDTTELFR